MSDNEKVIDSNESQAAEDAKQEAQIVKSEPQKRQVRSPSVDISVPSVSVNVTLKTLQAQKAFNRSFSRASASMYRVEVILRIIGSEENASQVEAIVNTMLDELHKELLKEKGVYEHLIEENAIDTEVAYSNAVQHTVQIPSPQVSRYLSIIRLLDEVICLQDTLWLSGLFQTNKEKNDNAFKWQQKVIGLGARIIGIERQARESAQKQGKGKDLEEAVPTQDSGEGLED